MSQGNGEKSRRSAASPSRLVGGPRASQPSAAGQRERYLQVGVLVACGVFVTLLAAPRSLSPNLPGPKAEGTFATSDVKADRDYDIVDVTSTERKREEAAARVRSVYNLYAQPMREAMAAVEGAFGLMQSEVAAATRDYRAEVARAQQEAREAARRQAAAQQPDGGVPDAGTAPAKADPAPAALPQEDPEVLAQRIDAALKAQNEAFSRKLGRAPLEEKAFGELRRARFSPAAATVLRGLIKAGFGHRIVRNKYDVLSRFGDGITVRHVARSSPALENEITLTDSGALRELEEVHQELDRRAEEIAERALNELKEEDGNSYVSPALMVVLLGIAKGLLSENMEYDRELTDMRRTRARAAVKDVVIPIKAGEMIIRDGDKIESRHTAIFKGIREQTQDVSRLEVYVGVFGIYLLIVLVLWRYARRNISKFRLELRDTAFLALSLCGVASLTWVGEAVAGVLADGVSQVPTSAYLYAIPVAAFAMMVRLVLNSEVALVCIAIASLLVGLQLNEGYHLSLYFFLSSAVAAHAVAQAKQRTTLLWAGVLSGFVGAAVVAAVELARGGVVPAHLLYSCLFAAGGGFVAAFLTAGVTPAVEAIFGYTTDIKLLELANQNHPVLRELMLHAPGSYYHSMLVGNLVESAAESIGANPLLARVMAYYHDIGKSKNPLYFAENQRGQNPHDKLSPSLSAVVIRSHVKDGVEMARKFRLGRPIEDAITMHHGTTLMRYFFHKAKAQENKELGEVKESDYRHLGPKPQYREAGLLMVADAVEAACKSIPDPTPARVQGMVQKIINILFTDGQFDECDLTLRDLNKIAGSFTHSLQSIYHFRPEYPDTQDAARTGADSPQSEAHSQSVTTAEISAAEVGRTPSAEITPAGDEAQGEGNGKSAAVATQPSGLGASRDHTAWNELDPEGEATDPRIGVS